MPRPRPINTKYCKDCDSIRPVEEFYSSSKYPGGFSTYCKECNLKRNRKRWIENPDGMRKNALKYYYNHKGKNREKAARRVAEYSRRIKKENPARWRAKKFLQREGVAPDITVDFLEELFKNTSHCQCCGKGLCLQYEERGTRQYRSNPNVPSIDRVNNHKGYTRSNIAVICWECNYRKTDLSLEDLEMMVAYIKKYGDFENV